VLHDLALAAEWADTVVVMSGGGLYVEGRPTDAVTPVMLRDVYGVVADVVALPSGSLRIDIRDLTDNGAAARQAAGDAA
jgi:iron complex transport system ATP-binding protein